YEFTAILPHGFSLFVCHFEKFSKTRFYPGCVCGNLHGRICPSQFREIALRGQKHRQAGSGGFQNGYTEAFPERWQNKSTDRGQDLFFFLSLNLAEENHGFI